MSTFAAVTAFLILLILPGRALAQELEPGAYWPIPTGLNIVTVVNSFNWGDVAFDAAAPIDEAAATINTTAFSFTRAFGLAGRSANASVAMPVVTGHVEGLYLGAAADVDRFGLGDPRLRLAVNLYGAPAMVPKSFASYQQRTLVGVSITVAPPLGEYDSAEVDQPRHQPLVVQAGDRLLADLGTLGGRGDGRGLAVHRQRQLLRGAHA